MTPFSHNIPDDADEHEGYAPFSDTLQETPAWLGGTDSSSDKDGSTALHFRHGKSMGNELNSEYRKKWKQVKGSTAIGELTKKQQHQAFSLIIEYYDKWLQIGDDSMPRLSKEGIEQGRMLNKKLRQVYAAHPENIPDLIVCSPYPRARESAYYAYEGIVDIPYDDLMDLESGVDLLVGENTIVRIDDRLQEEQFDGGVQLSTWANDILNMYSQEFSEWLTKPKGLLSIAMAKKVTAGKLQEYKNRESKSESVDAIQHRVTEATSEILAQGKNIATFEHHGTVRARVSGIAARQGKSDKSVHGFLSELYGPRNFSMSATKGVKSGGDIEMSLHGYNLV